MKKYALIVLYGIICDMDLKTYMNSITSAEREKFAESLGTSSEYLRQIVRGHKKPSNIERILDMIVQSDYQLTIEELRPDLFPNNAHGKKRLRLLKKICA